MPSALDNTVVDIRYVAHRHANSTITRLDGHLEPLSQLFKRPATLSFKRRSYEQDFHWSKKQSTLGTSTCGFLRSCRTRFIVTHYCYLSPEKRTLPAHELVILSAP
jgi:hypothetical protein